jgi:uncharacterized coiled-coil DUF342 family protein
MSETKREKLRKIAEENKWKLINWRKKFDEIEDERDRLAASIFANTKKLAERKPAE